MVFLLVACLPLFLGLGSVALFSPEETRYAEMAREMAEGGDWLVPRMLGYPYLEKPPLTVWLAALSFRLFGVSAASARLVPLFGAVLTLAFTVLLARRLGGSRCAFLAGSILATSPLFAAMARILSPDMPFAAALSGGLWALLHLRERCSAGASIGLGVAAAAAFLTKGLAGPVLLGAGALCLAWMDRSWKSFARFLQPAALGAFLVLGLPWFLWVEEQYPSFLRFFFLRHHLDRYLGEDVGDRDLHAEPFHYFVPVLLGGLFLWSAFLPSGYRSAWREGRPGEDPRPLRALWAWAVLGFLFFSAGSGKRVPYLLPLLPAAAVGLSSFWVLREGSDPRRLVPRWGTGTVLGVALLFLVVSAFLPKLEAARSVRSFAARAAELVGPERPLVCFPHYYAGLSFYGVRHLRISGSPHELEYGMELEPQRPSPMMGDGEFGGRIQAPGTLLLFGSRSHLLRNLPRWDPQGRWERLVESERWMLLRN